LPSQRRNQELTRPITRGDYVICTCLKRRLPVRKAKLRRGTNCHKILIPQHEGYRRHYCGRHIRRNDVLTKSYSVENFHSSGLLHTE